MKAGSMEGLIGASVNLKMAETPMRVYKEAERRGDTEVMERAMGYVTDFQEKAQKYSDKAQEELAKELKEEREEQELKREQAIEKRREETKEYKEKLQESSKSGIQKADSVEISEEGKVLLKDNTDSENTGSDEVKMDAAKKPVTYSKIGETVSLEQNTSISVSI